MAEGLSTERRDARVAMLQLLVLLAFGAFAFLPVLSTTFAAGLRNSETAHALAAPLLIGLLIWRRRKALEAAIGPGSVVGLIVIILSIFTYSVARFPLNYKLAQWWSMLPALAGAIWAVAGWSFLKRCLPMLVILWLAIPINARFWAYLVIRPETITTQLVEQTLDMLPGVFVELTGSDLHYERGEERGAIALGQHFRGVQLLRAYATLYVFVAFMRIRPTWQMVTMVLGLAPVVLFANFLRLQIWGAVTIYTSADPVSMMPRVWAIVLSLLALYVMAVALAAILDHLTVAKPEASSDAS